MTMYEEMKAQVPLAFDEIWRHIHVRPTSVGITKKGHALAFGVSLPADSEEPKPDVLFGHPVVYWVAAAPGLLRAHG
jgi:hypothetical protein